MGLKNARNLIGACKARRDSLRGSPEQSLQNPISVLRLQEYKHSEMAGSDWTREVLALLKS